MRIILLCLICLGLFIFLQPTMAGKVVRAVVVAPFVVTNTITPEKYDRIIEEYHW